MYDNEARTNQVEGFDPITDAQQHLARLQICAHTSDAAEATELMRMLGIFPGEEDPGLLTKPDNDFNRVVKTRATPARRIQSRSHTRRAPR